MTGRSGAVLTRGYIAGGAELIAALERLRAGLKDELLVQATWAGADVLKDEWKSRVPVEDGDYRDAIVASAKPGKKGATGLVQVGSAAGVPTNQQPRRYAARLEFGTGEFGKWWTDTPQVEYNIDPSKIKVHERRGPRKRAAQPSLRPAFDSCKGQMLDTISDTLRRLIEQATP